MEANKSGLGFLSQRASNVIETEKQQTAAAAAKQEELQKGWNKAMENQQQEKKGIEFTDREKAMTYAMCKDRLKKLEKELESAVYPETVFIKEGIETVKGIMEKTKE